MRITLTRFAVFAVIAALVVGFGASRSVLAQDAMQTKVVCDADLILSLYTAEYRFDFAAVEDKMMAANTGGAMATKLDLTAYDYGQFAPLFEAMMSKMDSSMSMGMLDEQTMTSVTNAMQMDQAALNQAMMMESTPEAMTDGAMMESTPEATNDAAMMQSTPDAAMGAAMMTDLAPVKVDGEPAECTTLRDELRHFYTALAYSGTMMSQSQ